MRRRRLMMLLLVLAAGTARNALAATTAPESVPQAQVAMTFNAAKRCPALKIAEEDGGALVLFQVGRSGEPSQISIKSSSASADLDAAAMECVRHLRFQPATRLGDGEPILSWQQMGWVWAKPARTDALAEPTAAGGQTAPSRQAGQSSPPPARQNNRVSVHVCTDPAGQLAQEPTVTRSSGDSQLDEAAVKIARSGAPYYGTASAGQGKAVARCAQLTVDFDAK
jgi:TonB family protein